MKTCKKAKIFTVTSSPVKRKVPEEQTVVKKIRKQKMTINVPEFITFSLEITYSIETQKTNIDFEILSQSDEFVSWCTSEKHSRHLPDDDTGILQKYVPNGRTKQSIETTIPFVYAERLKTRIARLTNQFIKCTRKPVEIFWKPKLDDIDIKHTSVYQTRSLETFGLKIDDVIVIKKSPKIYTIIEYNLIDLFTLQEMKRNYHK